MENVVIIGAGISGLTAAIYAARGNLFPKVFGGLEEGGQLMLTTEVENFPGFPDGIKGPQLIEHARKQAKKFGAGFIAGTADKITKIDGGFEVFHGKGSMKTKTIILCTGANARMLGLPSEQKYVGRGVSTCATCDAFFYKDKEVAMIGGGDAAIEEAGTLSKFANKVYLVHRRDALRASKIMQDRLKENSKIEVVWNSVVQEVLGDEVGVTGLRLRNTKTDKLSELKVDGMFLGIGHIPNTKFIEGFVDLDEKGFIKVHDEVRTSVEGVFVGGDVADPVYQQAITAAGSGCKAALMAEKYVESNGGV
ncbi:MAG: thioredoxin-disulfide reductase [DPANN group archaeon]|nr:thioredoxin-disulfide reductase [DPANN group archaeon]